MVNFGAKYRPVQREPGAIREMFCDGKGPETQEVTDPHYCTIHHRVCEMWQAGPGVCAWDLPVMLPRNQRADGKDRKEGAK